MTKPPRRPKARRPPAKIARTPAKPRWRRRKDDRPAEILAAALEAFATRGFAATKLDEVADKAGISKGTLYLYFPNKEALFKAVVREMLVPNLVKAEAALAHAGGPSRELLLGIMKGLVGVAGTRLGAIPKLVIAEAGNFPDLAKFYLEEIIQRGMGMFTRVLQRGIDRGEFKAVDAAVVPPVLAAPILVLAIWKNVFEPHAKHVIDPEKFFAAYTEIMFDGLALPNATQVEK